MGTNHTLQGGKSDYWRRHSEEELAKYPLSGSLSRFKHKSLAAKHICLQDENIEPF